jgi:RNA polymerase sigma-70 factor (ECF subfamily)
LTPAEEQECMLKIQSASEIQLVEKDFNQLYDSLSKKLWGKLSKKFIPPFDVEDLKDVFQEGWRKVIENRKYYKDGYNVYNWIYTIIKNTALDFSKKDSFFIKEVEFFKNSNVKDNYNEETEHNKFDIIPDDTDLIEDLHSKDIIRIINEEIEKIEDELDREIFIKRVVEGIKYNEIAKMMDMPVATVHYRINNLINEMKPRLQKIFNM